MTGIVGILGRWARVLPPSRTKSRAGRAVATMLATVGSDPVQLVVMHDGSRLYLDARERTEGGPFWNGSYSPDELSILQASFDANLTFVDVGANVGLISIPMIRFIEDRGAGGRVVAVEPVPANVARLKRSLALTPSLRARVTAVETALGASAGTIAMTTERREQTSNATVSALSTTRSARLSVPLATLDDVLQVNQIANVDLIKLDVEGFELEVLIGARRCLERMRPIVFGEFHNVLMPKLGATFRDVVDLTRPMGYRYFGMTGPLEVIEVPEPPTTFGNAFLVPDERVDRWRRSLTASVDRDAKRE